MSKLKTTSQTSNLARVLTIIPAYNEEKTIGRVINDLKTHNLTNILVVNDGSADKTAEIAQSKGVNLISHPINRGLGAALGTGLECARRLDPGGLAAVVTFDADSQHKASDALRVVQPILDQKADVVIGARQHELGQVPLVRFAGNWALNILTFLFFGVWTVDSQSGLRAFSPKALKKLKLKSNRMEVSSEIFQQIKKHQLKLVEVPIASIYTRYSLKKGQDGAGTLNGLKIISRLILRSVGH